MSILLIQDSLITPKDLAYYSKKQGLDATAVTDHDKLEGAFKIAKETDFLIIPHGGLSEGTSWR
jgi:predicted metal-dependent phosphoesterase TrpH